MIKMKIETGEYIRTKDGIIAKCIEEKQDRYIFNRIVLEQGYYNNYILKDIPERANFITKHSKNIIDLVEVGDYVNGERVLHIDNCLYGGEKVIITELNKTIYDNMIKSIVTKQQFNNIELKI